jgi:hypothetical protein
MERKAMLLHVSLNPSHYDLETISQFTYDEALNFVQNDTIGAMTWDEELIELSRPHELSFHADGVENGEGGDTMFNWLKVL